MGTFQHQSEAAQTGHRVLRQTQEKPMHPVSIHPRVPEGGRHVIHLALMAMARSNGGTTLLDRVPISRPVPAKSNEYLFWPELAFENLKMR